MKKTLSFSQYQIILLSFTLAFCSFSYEIILAFCASSVTSLNVLSKTLTLGSFILGLGIGGLQASRLSQEKLYIKKLIQVEIWLSLVGALSIPVILGGHGIIILLTQEARNLLVLLLTQPVALAVGYFSGFELPLLTRWGQKINLNENIILGSHYLGVLTSSLVIFTIMIPYLDMLVSIILISLLNSVIALLLLLKLKKIKPFLIRLSLVVICICSLSFIQSSYYQFYLKMLYHEVRPQKLNFKNLKEAFAILQKSHAIDRRRSLYQYIDIVESPLLNRAQQRQFLQKTFEDIDLSVPRIYSLFLNRQVQFSSTLEKTYHEQMAHVPIEYFKNIPQTVLILGAGDGLLARELLKYKDLKIDLVELDPEVSRLARYDERLFFQNKGSLTNSRIKIYNTDAIFYLRHLNKDKKYDAIFLDFPYPDNYDVSKLFSYEFYRWTARFLNPNGFLVLDVPLDFDQNPKSTLNELIINTLFFAGIQHIIPYGTRGGFIMAQLGKPKPIRPIKFKNKNMSAFVQNNTVVRSDIIKQTKIHKKYVNSIFKPQKLGIVRGWGGVKRR